MPRHFVLLLLTIALPFLPQLQAQHSGFISCLQNIKKISPHSFLTTPSSNAYPIERHGFIQFYDYRPKAIYHPGSEADAVAAIRCAATFNVSIAPRSGGHSYEGYGQGGQDGSLVLDLNQLKQLDLDPVTGIATVGAGIRLGALYKRLWEHPKGPLLFPGGTCPSVGLGGHALGGGLGMLGRKYGMAVDSVLGLRMIDATGTVLTVSINSQHKSDRDLFWALRGAGAGSFGLVTAFEIQTYRAPPRITTLAIEFPESMRRAVLKMFGQWGKTATDDIMPMLVLKPDSTLFQATFLGPKATALQAVQPFLAMTKHHGGHIEYVEEGTWLDAVHRWADGDPLEDDGYGSYIFGHDFRHDSGVRTTSVSRFVRGRSVLYRDPMSAEEMDILDRYLMQPPDAKDSLVSTRVLVDLWGGQVDRPLHGASVFDHHRGVLYGIQMVVFWENPGFCESCMQWSSEFAQAMRDAYRPGAEFEAYQNYIERDLPNALRAYYGERNLPRLMQIKQAVDPTNVFTFPQAVPLPGTRTDQKISNKSRYKQLLKSLGGWKVQDPIHPGA